MRAPIIAAVALAVAATVIPVTQADAASAPPKFRSCKLLNAKYPHGVGLPGAKDKSAKPVTNFTRNKAVYLANHKLLDRDNDGIACEKH